MNTRHTPSPWVVKSTIIGNQSSIKLIGCKDRDLSDQEMVCMVPQTNEEQVANTLLIQSAPDMFAALQVSGPTLDPFFKSIGKATGVLRSGILLTPRFLVGQLIREPLTATIVGRSGVVTPFTAIKELGKIISGKSKIGRAHV